MVALGPAAEPPDLALHTICSGDPARVRAPSAPGWGCRLAGGPVGFAGVGFAGDRLVGFAGVYGPHDLGPRENGVIAQGQDDEPGWVYSLFDLAAIDRTRGNGMLVNVSEWNAHLRIGVAASASYSATYGSPRAEDVAPLRLPLLP